MLLAPCAFLFLAALPDSSLLTRGDAPQHTAPRGMGGGISRIPALSWTAPVWKAGDVITTVTTSRSSLATRIVANGELAQEFEQLEEKHSEKSLTILQCDARGPLKMRLEYRRQVSLQRQLDAAAGDAVPAGADEKTDAGPLFGQTFLLERENDSFRVLDASGTPVDAGLARLVMLEESAANGALHRAGDRFAREFAGQKLMPGDEIDVPREIARAFVDAHAGLEGVSMKVVPKPEISLEGEMVVAFDARIVIEDEARDGGESTDVELSGEVRVDAATGRFLSMELSGKLTLAQVTTDATRSVEVVGSGPWKLSESVTYSRVP